MILDTNFLGALDAGTTGAKALAEEIESNSLPARVPTPVVFEVFYGIENAENPDQLRPRYEALFANKPRVELTDQIARRGGQLYARHEASDTKETLDLVDAMVAAAGLDIDEPVVTNDSAFQDVDGLAVETY